MNASRASVHPETTLARAYLLMDQLKCHNLTVMSDDKVVGVICDRDIEHLLSIYSQGIGQSQVSLKVGNYMKTPVKSVDEDHALESVIRLMLDKRVQAVVIQREGQTLASVTRDDLLEILANFAKESKDKVVDHLEYLLRVKS